MKEKLTKNLGFKILSVLLAFFLWLLVVNISNPEVSRSQEVQLEFLNESVLLDAGETYEVNRRTVTVAYDVHTLDEGRIKASDFRATVDLSEVYDVTGSVQIEVEVLNNASLIRNVTPRPSVVHVTTEEMQSKEFALTANITGRPMENYSVNSVRLDPDTITVTGPVSQVGLINSVGVEINVMRAGDDLSGVTEPIFYDANGNALTSSSVGKVAADTEEISYYISIDRDREIPLTFDITGTPATGYRYAGYQATLDSVRLSGSDDVLSAISGIAIQSDELNIDDATGDRTVTIDISGSLPAGVYMTDPEQRTVVVRILIEELITRTIHLSESEITVTGMEEDLDYRFPNPAVTLTLRGVETELDTLRVEDYDISVDVSGLGEGTHSCQPQYASDDARFTVVEAEPVMVDISRRNAGPGILPDDRRPAEIRLPDEYESAEEPTAGESGITEDSTVIPESARESEASAEETVEENQITSSAEEYPAGPDAGTEEAEAQE